MKREGSVTLVRVRRGATPGQHQQLKDEGEFYYHLPEAAGDRWKVEGLLKKVGFKLGDRAFEHTPELGEEAHVVLLFYAHNDGMRITGPLRDVPIVSGEGWAYYYLPGASRGETIQALKNAHFQPHERLLKAVDAAYASKGDN